jgi:hypothetical protein
VIHRGLSRTARLRRYAMAVLVSVIFALFVVTAAELIYELLS